MKVSRGVEQSIEVGVEKMVVDRWRCRASVEEQPTISSTEARSIDLAVEKLSRRLELSRSIQQVSRRCQDCDKKKSLKARQIVRCRGGVEQAFWKQFFEKRKTQTWMQSIMQHNQWSKHHINLSILSLNYNFKHMDPKTRTHTHTHTHTHNKSNQLLYFKKQVKIV